VLISTLTSYRDPVFDLKRAIDQIIARTPYHFQIRKPMRRFSPALLAVSLLVVGFYLHQHRQTTREAALAGLETLRDFPWLVDPYRLEQADPRSDGLDTVKIDDYSRLLAHRGTKALIILHNDHVVHEWYAPLHGRHATHRTASLAKALVGSMALLLAMEDGLIKLDDPASLYIPAWRADPLRRMITVRDLANHSSGIENAEEDGVMSAEIDGWKGEYWSDPGRRFRLALEVAPVIFRPGSKTSYSAPGYAALGYALAASLRNSSVSDIRELLQARIMRPMGIPDNHWRISYGQRFQLDGVSLYLFDGGARYTARAAARVGQLIAHRGIWNGQEIISQAMVESLVQGDLGTQAVKPEWEPASAIGWWSNAQLTWPHLPKDTLVGAGDGHQAVIVVPSRELVVVRQGASLASAECGEDFWRVVDQCLLRPLSEIIDPPANHSAGKEHGA
jgi:CubicO group peptidase (beta-lactamase class C family)